MVVVVGAAMCRYGHEAVGRVVFLGLASVVVLKEVDRLPLVSQREILVLTTNRKMRDLLKNCRGSLDCLVKALG